MKFAPTSSAPRRPIVLEQNVCTLESVTEAYEGLLTAYMELSDAQRELDEVCQIMDNIDLSMKMIKTGGTAIKCLNVDGSLESLCNTADLTEAKVTAAMENAFTDTMKEFWEKVKAFFRRIYEWIRNLLPTREKVVVQTQEKIVEVIKEVEKPVEVVKEKIVTKEVVKKEDLFTKKSPVKNSFANLLRKNKIQDLIKAVATGVDVATGNTHDKISVKDLPTKYPQWFKENPVYPMPTWDYHETADQWTISGGDDVMISLSDLGYTSVNDINELGQAITVLKRCSSSISDSSRDAMSSINYADEEDEEAEKNGGKNLDDTAKMRMRAKRRMSRTLSASKWVDSASHLIETTMLWLLRIVTHKEEEK